MAIETKKAWAKSIEKPAEEFELTNLEILSGKIPSIKGSFFLNGPGRLERGGKKVGHWFDGDGAILAVHFEGEEAIATYRYVKTKGYQQETSANKFLYGNYGMTAPGGFWNQWLRPVKNSANTSILVLNDRLLALWEGGQPHALDLKNLSTFGLESLGSLKSGLTFSAHPKQDAQSGTIYNFGVGLNGLNANLFLYQCSKAGKITKKSSFSLSGLPVIHDFIMAGSYLIFLISPIRINFLSIISGLYSYQDAMEWKQDLGTQILVFNRENLELVSRGETDSWFQWHFGNGYINQDGNIVLDVARYDNFHQINQRLREVPGQEISTYSKCNLWQMQLNPQTSKVQSFQQLSNCSAEFPVVHPHEVGQEHTFTYVNTHCKESDINKELYNAIARFDHKTGSLIKVDFGENYYPSEVTIIPSIDDSEKSYALTVVYDGNSNCSKIYIFDSKTLTEPICILALPKVVPLGFHGTWKNSN